MEFLTLFGTVSEKQWKNYRMHQASGKITPSAILVGPFASDKTLTLVRWSIPTVLRISHPANEEP